MKDQIKSYLQRLNHGETLENVQADFVRECKDVDPSAIMQAEQELLREGTSIEELQRLCDVHSALFHGSATDAQKLHAKDIQDQRLSAAAALIQISGHPLQTFTLENAALEKLIARAKQVLENGLLFFRHWQFFLLSRNHGTGRNAHHRAAAILRWKYPPAAAPARHA